MIVINDHEGRSCIELIDLNGTLPRAATQIIELPVVLLDSRTGEVVGEYEPQSRFQAISNAIPWFLFLVGCYIYVEVFSMANYM